MDEDLRGEDQFGDILKVGDKICQINGCIQYRIVSIYDKNRIDICPINTNLFPKKYGCKGSDFIKVYLFS